MVDEVIYVPPITEPREIEDPIPEPGPIDPNPPEDIDILDEDEIIEVPEIEAGPAVVTEL